MDLFEFVGNYQNQDKKEEVETLVAELNQASVDYYSGKESMSDYDYDALYDKLTGLEKETGIVLPNSPTQNVGAAVVSKLEKVEHEYPALSLDKTKDVAVLKEWLKNKLAMLSWKMDGLTVCLTYDDGRLSKAVTRGNGYIGEDITHNALHFAGIPHEIPYSGHLVVRGEAVITYSEFERINASLPDDDKYKNPRNLASGTVRALDGTVCKEDRQVCFYAFQLVSGSNQDSFLERMKILDGYGFNTVDRCCCTSEDIESAIEAFKARVPELAYPTDGLVVEFDSVSYGESLGMTGHHPRYGMAYKWKDTIERTVLRNIEWSASRTGLINPVAVFDTVELEGTTVDRASLHNVSYIVAKDLRIGDAIGVYKANMIIPQVGENFSTTEDRSAVREMHLYQVPKVCPVCRRETVIRKSKDDVMTLHCDNPDCAAKAVGKYVHFCERDCMNIEGLSEKTIERFVQNGFIRAFADFWHLDRYEEQIVSMEGLGQKSYENIIAACEKARKTDFVSFIHACGIPNVGKGQAKLLREHLASIYDEEDGSYKEDGCYDFIAFMAALVHQKDYDFCQVEGFGEVIAGSLSRWISDYLAVPWTDGLPEDDTRYEIIGVLNELTFTDKPTKTAACQSLQGKVFVITGSLGNYKNRDELVKKIESLGGKVSGSVSTKTSYLINNDVKSTSGKNKKAKELNVPIISEDDFEKLL